MNTVNLKNIQESLENDLLFILKNAINSQKKINRGQYIIGIGEYWRSDGKLSKEIVDKFGVQFDFGFISLPDQKALARYKFLGKIGQVFEHYEVPNFIDIEFSPSYEESDEEPSLRILIDSDLDHFTVVSCFELSLKCLGEQQAYAFLNEVQKYVNWLRLSI